jgi:hypothetical protein
MAMSVGSIIGGGIRLVRTQPRTIAIWGGLNLVLMVGMMAIFFPAFASMIEAQRQAAADAALGMSAPRAIHSEIIATVFLLELAYCLYILILFAAAVRAVARPTGDRFAYLRIGMDELRLFGLVVLIAIVAIVVEVVAILLFAIIGAMLGAMIGKAGGIAITVILGVFLFGAAIYAQIRLSLTGAFTVIRGGIVIRDAWRATKGQFWTLFGAYLLIGLVFAVISFAMIAVTNPHLMAAYASMDPQAINAAAQEQIARQAAGLSVAMVAQIIIGTFLGTVMMAVACGAVATAAVELQADG